MTTRSVVREAPAVRSTAGRIDRLVARASVCAEEVRGHMGAATVVASVGAREAMASRTVRDREAWIAYGERVDQIAAEAEGRLVEARAELDLALAESRHDMQDAASRLLDQWSSRLADLKVQAALARMEATDDADPVITEVEDLVGRAARRARFLRDGSEESLELMRTGIVEAFGLVQEGFDEAMMSLRRAARPDR